MSNTFTWVPVFGAGTETEPRVNTVNYGDGYSQRVADGINTALQVKSVLFQGTTAVIDAIEAFLKIENGVTYFLWTPPGKTQKKWLCKKWSRVENAYNNESLSTTFYEVVG